MARDHGRILCKIWQDKDFRALPRTAQTLYMQLLSQASVNNAGVLPLQVSKWAKGCDELTEEDIWRDLALLSERGFIVVDTDTEEVLIRSFIRNDGGMAHKYIFKNALTCAEAVESPLLRKALAIELYRLKRAEATRVADILAPSADGDPMPSEWDSNAEVNPSKSHSNPIETASESEMAFESHSNHCGVGEGEGVGESSVVGHLGGVARTHARDAHTREGTPTPNQTPSTPYCDRHPGGTPDPCRACAETRKRYEASETARIEAETARRIADARAQSEAAQQRAADRRAAIAACGMCDADGYVGLQLCDHTPEPSRRPSIREQYEALKRAQEAAETASPSPGVADTPENPSTATTATETTDQEPAHA
ncbi:hypothetical protein [Nocardia cyriacigeorgica]|uniref:hypothetical protein n=1 Tax=Nocardia cyriacigeorgica TaxID=135487 RepID=UPI0024564B20|nr:hypothetical protein [Nocardia cyriacigeorgica]